RIDDTIVIEVCAGIVEWITTSPPKGGLQDGVVNSVKDIVVVRVTRNQRPDLQLGGWSTREGNSACFGKEFGILSAVIVGAGSQAINRDGKEAARISILCGVVYLGATHREGETDRL